MKRLVPVRTELAIAVIGGVLASMILSLIVTPAVHFYLSGGDSAGNA